MRRIDVTRRQRVTAVVAKIYYLGVEFARCSADTAAEKNVPTPTTFPADFLHCTVGRLTKNVPREMDISNVCIQAYRMHLRDRNFLI